MKMIVKKWKIWIKVLLEINGRSGDWLDQIGFVTYKGKKMTFGGKGGNPFIHNYYGSSLIIKYIKGRHLG